MGSNPTSSATIPFHLISLTRFSGCLALFFNYISDSDVFFASLRFVLIYFLAWYVLWYDIVWH